MNQRTVIIGLIFSLLGAVLFSGKAILAKLVYREVEIDVVAVLTLRMLFSMPVYAFLFFWELKGYQQKKLGLLESNSPMPKQLFLTMVAVGMLGYYVSSYLDFAGLKFISAGLERVLLFTYPSFTLLFAWLFYKTRVTRWQWLALFICYSGVVLAYIGDINAVESSQQLLGTLLVLGCAITYALYVLWSGRLIKYVGSSFFTSVAMLGATAGVALHFLLSGNAISSLLHLPPLVYFYIFLMAIFTTVVPSYLMAAGIKRIGSSNMALVSTIGPMATILQAYWFLGEGFGPMQMAGTLLVVAGVLVIGRKMKG